MTPFERKLQRQLFRRIPTEWRDTILGEAKDSENLRSLSEWREWIWPSPLAWVAIAAVWLLFLSVDAIDRELSDSPNSHQMVKADDETDRRYLDHSDRSLLFTWRERDRLLANLN